MPVTLTRDGCLWNSFIYFLFYAYPMFILFINISFFAFFFLILFLFNSFLFDLIVNIFFIILLKRFLLCSAIHCHLLSSFIGRSAAYDSHIHSLEISRRIIFFCNSPLPAKKQYPRTLLHSMTLFSLGLPFQYLTSITDYNKKENVSL